MGRPSLAEQRKAEILDAFGRCVARFGLEGSTLEHIAEEAGMKRSILRHYLGNRDDLVHSLARKVIADYRGITESSLDTFRDGNRSTNLVDFLLPTQAFGSTEQLLILEGLIGASGKYPRVMKLVRGYVEDFVDLVAQQLKLISPETARSRCWDTAYALVCISFNQESLQPLKLEPKYLKAARKMARDLIKNI
ncbi:MAG: TetR/AcrR family transcriptional regulator [Planctomycetota bacterium]